MTIDDDVKSKHVSKTGGGGAKSGVGHLGLQLNILSKNFRGGVQPPPCSYTSEML